MEYNINDDELNEPSLILERLADEEFNKRWSQINE
jgi:hypothetical protein